MAKITNIEGIGKAFGLKLEKSGIPDESGLLAEDFDRKGRKSLAKRTGIDEKQILKWVNRAKLSRIRGVGSQYADLLEVTGFDTVRELAQRKAATLHAKMAAVNKAKNLVRQMPSEKQVSNWIEQAGALPRVVTC